MRAPRRVMWGWRRVVMVVGLAVVAAGVAWAATGGSDERPPLVVSSDVGSVVPGSADGVGAVTGVTTSKAVAVATPSTSASSPSRAEATGNNSVTVVNPGSGGVVVTNEGTAIAETGGNTATGSTPGGPPPTVVTGGASAVGNQSSTQVGP